MGAQASHFLTNQRSHKVRNQFSSSSHNSNNYQGKSKIQDRNQPSHQKPQPPITTPTPIACFLKFLAYAVAYAVLSTPQPTCIPNTLNFLPTSHLT